MSDNWFPQSDRPLEEEVTHVLANLVSKHEHRVDALLRRLRIIGKDPRKALDRLDRYFLVAAASAGLAKGIGTTARKNLRVPARVVDRAASVGLLSLTVIYILGQARVRGLSTSDERVQNAVRSALLAAASLPVGQMLLENLARFARPAAGLPTDPRTWFVMAAGAAGGGIAGNTVGRGIVDSVNAAFDDVELPIDVEFTVAEDIDQPEGQRSPSDWTRE